MVTDLVHLSLNNIEKLSESHESHHHHHREGSVELSQTQHSNPSSGGGSWMWNPSRRHHQEGDQDEESWEVRAFAEDTGSAMGTTWPPRSYTCTFCRREFRSAQALGGHMNVHRRDRARLHQGSSSPGPALIIPAQELMAAAAGGPGGGGGLCFLYHLPPNHNPAMYSAATPTNNMDAWAAPPGLGHQYHRQSYNKLGESPNSSSIDHSNCKNNGSSSTSGANNMEELDLELRL